jgi:hypothetical protein
MTKNDFRRYCRGLWCINFSRRIRYGRGLVEAISGAAHDIRRSSVQAPPLRPHGHGTMCALVRQLQLSYRDLVERMAERGLCMAHTTIMRWVLKLLSTGGGPDLDMELPTSFLCQ